MAISSASPLIATFARFVYNAVGGETSISGADANGFTLSYTPGREQVYLNGVMLARTSDYTASTGTTITGLSALVASDIVEVLAFSPFSIADAIPSSLADVKGDIFVATADNTVNRFAIGANNQALLVDSSTTTGVRWGDDYIVNAVMGVWE